MGESMVTRFTLKGGEHYITERPDDAFRVEEGSVLVFVVPLNKNGVGRRSFIYEAPAGESIPAFVYRDMEYCQWRFCLVAAEEARLCVIEGGATKVLKQKFAQRAKIRNYKVEGFEGGLVDQYRINTVTEDGFIRRSQKQRTEDRENIFRLIYSSFTKKEIEAEVEETDNALYNAVAVLGASMKIHIASYDKVKETCGDKIEISDIARLSHVSYREVLLTDGWQDEDAGPFLVFNEKKKPLVCLQKGTNHYVLYDPKEKALVPVSRSVARSLQARAYMLYRPFPTGELKTRALFRYCMASVRVPDMVWLVFLTVVTALIGLLTPTISQQLYDTYIPLGSKAVLLQLGCFMAAFMISNILFSIVKNLVNFRITSRMGYDVQAAVYDRLFNLPESFFRQYESADLAQRVMGAGTLVNTIASSLIMAGIAVIYIVLYFVRMVSYSVILAMVGILMLVVYSVLYYLISVKVLKYGAKTEELTGKTDSVMFQLLTGISKIRIAGVEDRALYEYMKPYVTLRGYEAKKNTIEGLGTVLNLASNSIFSLILYMVVMSGSQNISLGSFIAFNTVFGSFAAYLMQIVGSIIQIRNEKPSIERLKPVLDAEPELNDEKELPGDLSGAIEINNVSFAYSEDAPLVLDNLSLNIKPGEYVGLVGSSGCGKSTLLKLLLGFEKPTSGKVYYDNKDIESVDKRELRKKMGVVLQDGRLISGSIFENVTITAPTATTTDVNRVIRAVGLEDDIKNMPMGLHTVVSEDGGTISGGQQQRILIARAIIANPSILFFDEATSALDNVTQNMVCETLEAMNSTRIVIAHRLSTIMKCDRIIVLDGGKIVEQGNYEELMEQHGLFWQLASRQIA